MKGIGEYTAAAICSIAYGDSFPVVDGNVLRVICRFKGMHEPVNSVKCKNSVTGAYLSNKLMINIPKHLRNGNKKLR